MKGFKKKHILSAFLLALALAVAPLGNVLSLVATASSGNGNGVYRSIYQYVWAVSNGKLTAEEALKGIYTGHGYYYGSISSNKGFEPEQLPELIASDENIKGVIDQLKMMANIPIEDAAVEISDEVKQQVSSVSVMGAEMSAADGQTVTLNVAVPAQQASVNVDRMVKAVQLDISISGVKDSHNLDCPAIITMPLPAGFSTANNIMVLHYVNGVENDPVNVPCAKNPDGTISFSTSSFSVFVVVEVEPVGEDEPGDEPEEEPEEQPAGQPVKDSVPKTDDSTVPVLPFAAAGVVFAAAACVLKKRGQE